MLGIPDERNRDVSLSFDNNVHQTATMSTSIRHATAVKFDPPITSSTMKVTVKLVYSKVNNGFAEIYVYETGKKNVFWLARLL